MWMGESDGGDVDNGEERIVVGLLAVRGEDEYVMRVVDVERNELCSQTRTRSQSG